MTARRMRKIWPNLAFPSTFAAALACVALTLGAPDPAGAQTFTEACKAEKVGPQMVDFGTAYAAADKRARSWQSDVVVVRLTHTSLGPIDADARSANWYMVWFSPGTKQRIAITIANGGITCYADAMAPGRLPALKPDFYRDVKQLLATAATKGGAALMGDGAQPAVELSAGPPSTGGKGIWYVNYRSKGGKSLQVTFDGSTGQFEKAIAD
jgi:hypothetical protein